MVCIRSLTFCCVGLWKWLQRVSVPYIEWSYCICQEKCFDPCRTFLTVPLWLSIDLVCRYLKTLNEQKHDQRGGNGLRLPSVGNQVFEEAWRAKRCSWNAQKSRSAQSLWEERERQGSTSFDSATALHFWSVKQLSKIDWHNSLPQYPKPARYLWFWQKTLLPRGSELLQIYSFCSFWPQSSCANELGRAAQRVSLLPLGNHCQHYSFR